MTPWAKRAAIRRRILGLPRPEARQASLAVRLALWLVGIVSGLWLALVLTVCWMRG